MTREADDLRDRLRRELADRSRAVAGELSRQAGELPPDGAAAIARAAAAARRVAESLSETAEPESAKPAAPTP